MLVSSDEFFAIFCNFLSTTEYCLLSSAVKLYIGVILITEIMSKFLFKKLFDNNRQSVIGAHLQLADGHF